jgi:DNA-binding MarR family transcriptional regulator
MGKKGKSKGKGGRDRHELVETGGDGVPVPVSVAEPAPPVDPSAVATRLNSAAILLIRRLNRDDAALGLSSTRLSALRVLVFGGPRTLGQLADTEGVTAPSMTRLVTAMERDGLVVRGRSATDGRLVIVSATKAGADLLHRGGDQRVDTLAGLVAELPSADQRCLETAAGVLESLLRSARRS